MGPVVGPSRSRSMVEDKRTQGAESGERGEGEVVEVEVHEGDEGNNNL
jgi:hypothetical protein